MTENRKPAESLVREFLAVFGERDPTADVLSSYINVLTWERYGWKFLQRALRITIPRERGEGRAPSPLALRNRLSELLNLENQALNPQAAMPECERMYWRYIESGADPLAAAGINGLDHENFMHRITKAMDGFMMPGNLHDGWPPNCEPDPANPGDLVHMAGMTPARIEQLICMRLLGTAALQYGVSGMLPAYLTAAGGSRRVLHWTVPLSAELCRTLAVAGLESKRPCEENATFPAEKKDAAKQTRNEWLTMLGERAVQRKQP